MRVESLSLTAIRPSPHNPRLIRDRDPDLASLAESIAALGVLQPVLVRPVHGVNGDGVTHELIAGERRFRAAGLAGLAEIPALVREDLDDHQALELTVTENLQREDLHPLEEAKGVASLLGDGHDYRTVADRLGKSLGWVARRARLATLSAKWKKLAEDPKSPVSAWPATMLELVARLEPAAQDEFLDGCDEWFFEEFLTADELGRHLAELTKELRLAPWGLGDETLEPKAGACTTCPKRSSCNPGLFDDDLEPKKAKAGDRCLDATCWERKLGAWLESKARSLEGEHGAVVFVRDMGHDRVPTFVKERGAKLVGRWDGRTARKGDEGAVPALFVSGHDRGKVEWRVYTGAARSSAARSSGGGDVAKPKPMSLAEKRKKLEARRLAWALEEISRTVNASSPPSIDDVVELAAAYGTLYNATRPGNEGYGAGANPRSIQKRGDYPRALWRSVTAVMVDRWRNALNWQGAAGLAKLEPEIADVAKRIGLLLEDLRAEAAKAIPEPKSWAKQAAAEKATKKAKKVA